jgi:acyl-coenzyme A thioesterase PaaI-like protein
VGVQLIGEAVPVHRGRRIMVWQTTITTSDGTLVAMTVQTQLVVREATE